MIQLENYNADTNYNILEDDDIVNNLTSTATNKALSANQGKIINTKINNINNYLQNNSSEIVKTNLFWTDGKPLYRAFINLEVSTQYFNVSTELSSHGITNIGVAMFDFSKSYINYGSSLSNLKGFQPLCIYLGGNDSKGVFINGDKQLVIRGNAPTTEVMYARVVVCILFTKTTD